MHLNRILQASSALVFPSVFSLLLLPLLALSAPGLSSETEKFDFFESNTLDKTPEPTAQPSNLTFSNVKTYAYDVMFNHANPQPGAYIVLRSQGQAVVGGPADGSTYYVGDAIGNAMVIYVGSDTEFSPSGVLAGTTFHHSIFSFNPIPGSENYLQNNPLTGAVSTPANMMGNYYNGVNSNSETFVETLQDKIRPHHSFNYGDYLPVMIYGFESRDTSGGQKVVYCVYTGFAHVYDEPFGWIGSPGGTLSREHTFAFSWFPHESQSAPEYSDFYNLFPSHQNNANARRSNHPLGVVQHITYAFLDGKLGKDAQGNTVYEPRDTHKGDAARALFYMVTRYHNSNNYQWYLPMQQNQEILKLWHFSDPPDAWEIARNDYIFSKQGNRNPFVDSIHFVTKIDFRTMEWLGIGQKMALANLNTSIFPNPATDHIQIELQVFSAGELKATLFTITGTPVKSIERNLSAGNTSLQIELTSLPQGAYILNIIFKDQSHSVKVLKM